ncbi:hypothetical protein SDC9_193579 [bioreactor metagenome]|uniref:Uncharacterized protein n=1 Tax=bioreactor metagenome TaxID=1076179 RepID=A0A645I4G6_9ZZZZ
MRGFVQRQAVLGHHDAVGTDFRDLAVDAGRDHGAGIDRNAFFQPGADQRRFRHQKRHRLTLHVRTHQRAVGVVVFQERNDPGGGADQLLR